MIIMGIQKKIDTLGRIVLPKEIREIYKIKPNDLLEIIPTEEGIMLRKSKARE